MSASKLILGTAQLGNAYGVNNVIGELDESSAFDVLAAAEECGIRLLDTAEAYGKSQDVIGRYIVSHPDCAFEVCTKLSNNSDIAVGRCVREHVQQQLDTLHCADFFIYYLHDFEMCEDGQLLESLSSLREEGLIKQVGVSIYEPQELERIVTGKLDYIDAVQIPLNVFNCHRWLGDGLLGRAVDAGIAILARSVYLQGVVFMDPDDSKIERLGISSHLRRFQELAIELRVKPERLAFDFVESIREVSFVLLGCETPDQVRSNAAVFDDCRIWTDELVQRQIEDASTIPDVSVDPRFW